MKNQVKDLVALVEMELKEISDKKDKNKTFVLAIFGLLITMFSLVSAYKDIREIGWIDNKESISEEK